MILTLLLPLYMISFVPQFHIFSISINTGRLQYLLVVLRKGMCVPPSGIDDPDVVHKGFNAEVACT